MKILLAISGAMLCAFAITACAVDDPSEATDHQALAAASATEPTPVPPELSADPLPDSNGNPFGRVANACHVSMFCHDTLHGLVPSYCANGQCGDVLALQLAHTFCVNNCPNANCNNILRLPSSPSC